MRQLVATANETSRGRPSGGGVLLEVKVKKKLGSFTLDVDFSVDNEILAVLGPSGSGKTVTMQCVAGLIRPDEGIIKLNGEVLFDSAHHINLSAQRRKIGFVFQNYALFPHLTVRENIEYGISHQSRSERDERVAELLVKTNIQGLADRYPRQLSSGQQQRVALARTLAPEPELILLDEPFSALDIVRTERLELELLALQRFYKGGMIIVTHDFSQGYRLGSKIAIYESGRIVQWDDRDRVISSPASHTVARLMGVKNLARGHIIGQEGRKATIALPALGCSLRAIVNEDAVLGMYQPVTLGIRPEYISVTDRLRENTLLGAASQIVDEVTHVNYYFQISTEWDAGISLLATFPKINTPPVRVGEPCYIYLPPEHITVITD